MKKIIAGMLLLATITFGMSLSKLNSATKAELMEINGIGEVKAAEIIKQRRKGKFKSFDDLMERVDGIGEQTAANIKGDVKNANDVKKVAKKTKSKKKTTATKKTVSKKKTAKSTTKKSGSKKIAQKKTAKKSKNNKKRTLKKMDDDEELKKKTKKKKMKKIKLKKTKN